MDVFAFGSLIVAVRLSPISCIVLCHKVPLQVMTNDAPYRGRNPIQILSRIMKDGHSRILDSLSGIISDDILNLVRRCWAHNPNSRPSMGEVVAVLVT